MWTSGDQTNKKRGPIQSLFEGGGQGLRPIEPALRHRVPLPCSSSDPCELDPGEQCEWGWEWREAGGWIICLGNKAAFLSDNNWQARFHFPALLWRAALFLWWFQTGESVLKRERAHFVVQVCLSEHSPSYCFSSSVQRQELQVKWGEKKGKKVKSLWAFEILITQYSEQNTG